MYHFQGVTLRRAIPEEAKALYQLITEDERWAEFNGPYFPYQTPTLEGFRNNTLQRLMKGEDMLLIEFEGKPVGSVSWYWECESTRWLEAGIVIYDSDYWNKGLGFCALVPWISHIFDTQEIERVGLTTWSGNPRMMRCAEKLGMQQEARIRKVRYYQGEYYDSIKYGVLREEWQALIQQLYSQEQLA